MEHLAGRHVRDLAILRQLVLMMEMALGNVSVLQEKKETESDLVAAEALILARPALVTRMLHALWTEPMPSVLATQDIPVVIVA